MVGPSSKTADFSGMMFHAEIHQSIRMGEWFRYSLFVCILASLWADVADLLESLVSLFTSFATDLAAPRYMW